MMVTIPTVAAWPYAMYCFSPSGVGYWYGVHTLFLLDVQEVDSKQPNSQPDLHLLHDKEIPSENEPDKHTVHDVAPEKCNETIRQQQYDAKFTLKERYGQIRNETEVR